MSGVILAVDTSNYTTSAALCDGREVINTASRLRLKRVISAFGRARRFFIIQELFPKL